MSDKLRFAAPHLVMLVVCLLLYAAAMKIDTSGGGGRIGPEFWPKLVVGLMTALCAYEAVRRLWVGPSTEAVPPAMNPPVIAGSPVHIDPEGDGQPEPTHRAQLAAGLGLVFGYVLVIPWLGFFVTTALFLAAFSWIGGFRRPWLTPLIALIGSLLMVVLFMRVAYISLPPGVGVFHQLSVALLSLLGVK